MAGALTDSALSTWSYRPHVAASKTARWGNKFCGRYSVAQPTPSGLSQACTGPTSIFFDLLKV